MQLAMPLPLIDTHVHLNFPALSDDLAGVRERWQQAGVCQLVHSCVTPSEFTAIAPLTDQFPELFFAVGLHPLEAQQFTPALAANIRERAQSHAKIVAIGETGLDFYRADCTEIQFAALEAQLAIAQDLDLAVIIHCREAAKALADFLHQRQSQGRSLPRGVMHCWGGNPEETRWFLDLGFHISFSGTVTFKKATDIHESAAFVPTDRLLIETDCPFLAPIPQRGKRNEPAYVRHVAEQVARLRQTSVEAIAALTTANARHLFRLPTTVASVLQPVAAHPVAHP